VGYIGDSVALSTTQSGGYAFAVNAIHLFTFRGIPVFVSPMYLLLLVMFGYRNPLQGVILAVAITISLLVHEFGHALVARRLRHDPAIMLHGFGGLTSRSRTGRDVEEAAIVAMGPASGLALGLLVYGVWQLLLHNHWLTPWTDLILRALLLPSIVWNLLNLLPLWPLDGGQLLKLGTGRWLSAATSARITHGVALVLAGLLALYCFQTERFFSLIIVLFLGFQNVQALQGRRAEGAAPRTSPLALELVDNAAAALSRGEYKEAARLSHQARAQEGVSPALMERIWEILGTATVRLGEHEEALAYLRRARPKDNVRTATLEALTQLGRTEELAEIQKRWANTVHAPRMAGWLTAALAFIVLALTLVFTTRLFDMVL